MYDQSEDAHQRQEAEHSIDGSVAHKHLRERKWAASVDSGGRSHGQHGLRWRRDKKAESKEDAAFTLALLALVLDCFTDLARYPRHALARFECVISDHSTDSGLLWHSTCFTAEMQSIAEHIYIYAWHRHALWCASL